MTIVHDDWIIFSSFTAGFFFTVINVILVYVICKKKEDNSYTKYAYIELIIAVSLRVIASFFLGSAYLSGVFVITT